MAVFKLCKPSKETGVGMMFKEEKKKLFYIFILLTMIHLNFDKDYGQ